MPFKPVCPVLGALSFSGVCSKGFLGGGADQSATVLVRIVHSQGSTPRAQGAWMLVQEQGSHGSVGGGNLEWQASRQARQLLTQWQAHPTPVPDPVEVSYTLGPSLGQCCGGVLTLRFELLSEHLYQALHTQVQQARRPLALFGLGHVGLHLVRLLLHLPFQVFCFDSRAEYSADFSERLQPERGQANNGLRAGAVHTEEWVALPDDALHTLARLPSRSIILIMNHSHAEDFAICQAVLQRQRDCKDIAWAGLIGSASKWQGFQKRLCSHGFSPAEISLITSPIGIVGITGKEPATLALAIAAQLMQLPATVLTGVRPKQLTGAQ